MNARTHARTHARKHAHARAQARTDARSHARLHIYLRAVRARRTSSRRTTGLPCKAFFSPCKFQQHPHYKNLQLACEFAPLVSPALQVAWPALHFSLCPPTWLMPCRECQRLQLQLRPKVGLALVPCLFSCVCVSVSAPLCRVRIVSASGATMRALLRMDWHFQNDCSRCGSGVD
eukprot:6213907-Pleurochrysis_carterae.AAC.7